MLSGLSLSLSQAHSEVWTNFDFLFCLKTTGPGHPRCPRLMARVSGKKIGRRMGGHSCNIQYTKPISFLNKSYFPVDWNKVLTASFCIIVVSVGLSQSVVWACVPVVDRPAAPGPRSRCPSLSHPHSSSPHSNELYLIISHLLLRVLLHEL